MARSSGSALLRLGRTLEAIGAWPGLAASWLILPIIAAVLLAVVGSQLRVNEIVQWGTSVPLFGSGLTLTGLAELQWHLFGVMVLLGGAYALRADRHVRVDMVYEQLKPRTRSLIDLLGDLIFLVPFALLMVYLSLGFVGMAYQSGEQSDYGGLIDRYLIKAVMPIGFAFLALTAVGRIVSNLALLLGQQDEVRR